MGVCGPLRELTEFVERLERNAGEVTGVTVPDRLTQDAELTAEVELTFPFCSAIGSQSALSLRSSDVEPDGTLRLSFETNDPIVPSTKRDVETELRETTVGRDGTITAVLGVSVRTDESSTRGDSRGNLEADPIAPGKPGSNHAVRNSTPDTVRNSTRRNTPDSGRDRISEDGRAATPEDGYDSARTDTRDRDVPPFRDRELLADVYESCDTFAEMTAAIEMDVTPETVRRYMIDNGIHNPTSYDTGDAEADDTSDAEADDTGDAEADDTDGAEADEGDAASDGPSVEETNSEQTPVVLADGVGLPDEIDVDTIVEAVRKSRTIYEVKREIGVGREDAVETLREYNLLDLVVGRLSDDGRNEVTREEIVDRLREVSATR